jgi:hypothetical protein
MTMLKRNFHCEYLDAACANSRCKRGLCVEELAEREKTDVVDDARLVLLFLGTRKPSPAQVARLRLEQGDAHVRELAQTVREELEKHFRAQMAEQSTGKQPR